MHDQHGGLLYRESNAPNGKLWVDSAALARLWPTRFGAEMTTAGEVARLRERVELAEVMAEKALAEANRMKRELGTWRRR